MTVESASTINQLDATRPLAADLFSEGDDHMRLIKSAVKGTFPNITGVVTPTHLELNYLSGVTGGIQQQINNLSSSANALFSHSSTYAAGTVGARLKQRLSVKDAPYNATGDGTTDDYAAIAACIAAAGTTKTVYFPDGVYKISATLTLTVGTHIAAESDAAMVLGTGAIACFTIDSTSGSVTAGSFSNLRMATTVNTVGSCGIRVIGATNTFVSLWKFANLRFSGVYAGIKVEKGHSLIGGWYVSYFSVNQVSGITCDEYGANECQYGLLADGANTLTIQGGVIRGRITGIEIGDGVTGFGDITIGGIQFNYGTQTVKLHGSTTSTHYKHNCSLDGNQFDGDNLVNVWARNLVNFTLGESNNYAVGTDNDIQNCSDSRMAFKPLESRYGVVKTGIGIAADVPLFKLTPSAADYHAAYVEITVTGKIEGRGMGTLKAAYSLRTNLGVLTISAPMYTYASCDGAGTLALTVTSVSNEALFTLNQNSSLTASEFRVHATIVSDNHRFVLV